MKCVSNAKWGAHGGRAATILLALGLTGLLPTSAFAKGRPTPQPRTTIQNFSASGSGAGLAAAVACPTGTPSGIDCFALSGDLHGAPIGQATFTANLNVVSSLTPGVNGSDGSCAPASGTITINVGKNSTIALGFDGTQCDVGATPTAPAVGPTVLTGSFYVTGGTGAKFAELTGKSGPGEGGAGTGSLTLSGDDDGDVLATLAGILEFSPAPK